MTLDFIVIVIFYFLSHMTGFRYDSSTVCVFAEQANGALTISTSPHFVLDRVQLKNNS